MRLYVNVDHVATVREARRTDEPDPVGAARAAEQAGAHGITVHLREDRRHIHDDDVTRLAKSVHTVLNLELAAASDVLAIAVALQPYQATLVPERREEITTEGGLAFGQPSPIGRAVDALAAADIRVSLFIDPNRASIDAALSLGVPAVELHTGRYAHEWQGSSDALDELRDAARYGSEQGLAIHAGHGLTYANVRPLTNIPEIEELNIGHSIVSRSILVGMETAVREMLALLNDAR